MNIYSNFTPNNSIAFDDRDPPSMNDYVKGKTKWKSQLYETYAKNGCKCNDYFQLQEATNVVPQVVSNRKQENYNNIALNLNNPKTSTKTYWSILKTFYNAKNIPVVPPLLINNKPVSILKQKQTTLMSFFFCFPLYLIR